MDAIFQLSKIYKLFKLNYYNANQTRRIHILLTHPFN